MLGPALSHCLEHWWTQPWSRCQSCRHATASCPAHGRCLQQQPQPSYLCRCPGAAIEAVATGGGGRGGEEVSSNPTAHNHCAGTSTHPGNGAHLLVAPAAVEMRYGALRQHLLVHRHGGQRCLRVLCDSTRARAHASAHQACEDLHTTTTTTTSPGAHLEHSSQVVLTQRMAGHRGAQS